MDATDNTDPSEDLVTDETRTAEDLEASVGGSADRGPTPEEERLADESAGSVDPEVGEHYREMNEIGAEVRGEGEIGG